MTARPLDCFQVMWQVTSDTHRWSEARAMRACRPLLACSEAHSLQLAAVYTVHPAPTLHQHCAPTLLSVQQSLQHTACTTKPEQARPTSRTCACCRHAKSCDHIHGTWHHTHGPCTVTLPPGQQTWQALARQVHPDLQLIPQFSLQSSASITPPPSQHLPRYPPTLTPTSSC